MTVVLFHSVCGLRPAVRAAADRIRATGHEVAVPDLFDGRGGRHRSRHEDQG
jgi:dienelactone hydrolase